MSGGYEELRAYVISPAKTLTQPVGLDLWLKRGFMSWAAVMQTRTSHPPVYVSAQPGNIDVTEGLVTSLANILEEWSNKNDKQQN